MNRFPYHKRNHHGYRHHHHARNRHSQDIFAIGRNRERRERQNLPENHFNYDDGARDQSSESTSETKDSSEKVKSVTPKPFTRKDGKI